MIYKNGQPVNPLTIDLPPSKAIDESERSEFENLVKRFNEQMEKIEGEESVTSVLSTDKTKKD
jgi:hypothetical protein